MVIKQILKNIKRNTFDRLFPQLALELRRKGWEAKWSSQDYVPSWRIEQIPEEIQEAVDNDWFPTEASVLDIGCGSGEIAAWLAQNQNNYQVLGIDFSQSAIESARKIHSEIPGNLEFKVVDICRDLATSPQYNVLIDRGCFHTIPKNFASDYIKTVISWAMPGAKFLLFYATNKGFKQDIDQEEKMRQESIDYIKNTFQPMFSIVKIKPTLIHKNSVEGSASGIAVWMNYQG